MLTNKQQRKNTFLKTMLYFEDSKGQTNSAKNFKIYTDESG